MKISTLALIVIFFTVSASTANALKIDTQTPTPRNAIVPSIASSQCAALPPATGAIVNVSTVGQLESAVNNATSGTTILIADGTYNLNGVYLRIDVPNVTARSASGNRDAVILDGNYDTTEIIQIVASNVTIADLTLREAYYHPIHVMSTSSSDTNNTLVYNVHIIDPGEQAIKINPYTGDYAAYFTDNGIVACSHIELTDVGRTQIRNNCYTGGVDAHQSRGWVIRDNVIEGFWCQSGLSEHGVHMWNSCAETIVERNLFRNNARGVGFGMATNATGKRMYPGLCPTASGYVDHYAGVIRNNFVVATDSRLFDSQYGFDCGICLWNACNARALHNTVYTADPVHTFSAIEWRFANTNADIINNLVNDALMPRDGATATQSGNLTNAQASWLIDPSIGDLHLRSTATNAIDHAAVVTGVSDDYDGNLRPNGSASDVGADEYQAASESRTYLPLLLR
ncbi:MAG: hypothetical protein HZB51_02420 [Chloroflexi bacterium]|nr:hypothetical protein [Chloroflexota bacterium]